MAGQITGKFIGDFSSFNDAVNKAVVHLKGMETGASKVQTSLENMVNKFSGQKIIQDAELMVKAFELLQEKGIKLTTKELEKMGKTAEEAIAKLKAGGEAVPAGLQHIADAAAQVPPKLTLMQKAAEQAKGAFGQMFASFTLANLATSAINSLVSGLKNLVTSAVDGAGAIVDMANSTGLSIQTVQKFQGVAEQSGVSVDTLTRSVFKLTTTLAKGSDEAKAAVAKLGLSFEDLSRSSPDEAFNKIIAALEKMPPDFDRNLAMQQLFGKGSSEVAKLVADKYTEMAQRVGTASDEQIKALDKAGDAWVRFKRTATTSVTGFLGELVLAGEQAMKLPIWDVLLKLSTLGTQKTIAGLAGMATAGVKGEDVHLPKELPAGEAYKQKLDEIRKAYDNLSVANKRQIAEGKAISQNATQIAEDLNLNKDAVELYIASLDKQRESTEKNKKAWDDYITASLKAGAAEIAQGKKREDAIKKVNDQMDTFVNTHLKELGDRGLNILKLTTEESVKLGLAWMNMGPVIEGIGNDFIKALDPKTFKIRELPPVIKEVKFGFDDLSRSISQMATIAGGSFGAMASSVGTLIGVADTAQKSITAIGAARKEFAPGGGGALSGILGMASGIGGIVSSAFAAVGAIKQIWTALENREGRHAVEDFAESFGGFDALHAKLLEIGAAGEELWIKLTQGVPAGNPAYAARVIKEVEDALGKQADAADDVTTSTEDQAQATIETASQAAKAIEELAPKLAENEGHWQHWGDIVTAQIQRIANDIRAMPLPSAMAIAGGGNGGIHGGMGPIMNGDVVVRSNLYIDGYVAAESVSRQVVG